MLISQRSNIPKTKIRWFENPAIMPLVGVLVGSLITGGFQLLLAVRSEQTDRARAERAQKAEVRAPARLVADQLAGAAEVLKFYDDFNFQAPPNWLPVNPWQPPACQLMLYGAGSSWSQYREVLARGINKESFDAVSSAIRQNETFNQYCFQRANEEREHKGAGQRRDGDRQKAEAFYESLNQAVKALEQYEVD
jgi:hypothetical protein